MPHRIAFGSCSHPSLAQPLWKVIHERQPSAFIWGGDAVYSDIFAGLNWTAVGISRSHVDGWKLTFPPPSIHVDATPAIINGWYEKQWNVSDYRHFVEGWTTASAEDTTPTQRIHPIIYGTIDDHDYGQNNGDYTYKYKKESNVAFVDFLYSGVEEDNGEINNECINNMNIASNELDKAALTALLKAADAVQSPSEEEDDQTFCTQDAFECPDGTWVSRNPNDDCNFEPCEETSDELQDGVNNDEHQADHDVCNPSKAGRSKMNDPMYQRAIEGKGVYGVQLFDFSRRRNSSSSSSNNNILWGGGYWIPDKDASIDPDITGDSNSDPLPSYSITHSVAIFVLDVRSNKTPWPKGKQRVTNDKTKSTNNNIPALDFLGEHQWKWFESALENSRATVNIIVSGLQIHPERFPNDGNVIEEWSKYPEARQKLYNMILSSGVKSPILVSGDVHMAQIMRKDCMESSIVMDGRANGPWTNRPLVEITTSGMTHSWGRSFSSQPRHHRMPLKPYSYFVSRTFMTIAHLVCPWKDIVIQNAKEMTGRGQNGLQYYLGLNFAEFEFDFNNEGSVTTRIFGKEEKAPPVLEMKWTFDQLSGHTALPGTSAQSEDFLAAVQNQNLTAYNSHTQNEWICVPHRGHTSIFHEYAANITMFCTFCILFFLPHGIIIYLLLKAKRKWFQRRAAESNI